MRAPGPQFMRFVVAGALNTALTYGLFLLTEPMLGHFTAYTLVYILGIALSYLLNARFVFRTAPSWRTAMAFPLVYIAQYLWGLGVLHVLVDRLRWSGAAAMLAVIGSGVLLTYALTRWVMGDRSTGKAYRPDQSAR